ncbi:MAG: cytochrome c peroxidase [Sedimentisphaerales bacterium]|jgi:cytochrome c peroxidase
MGRTNIFTVRGITVVVVISISFFVGILSGGNADEDLQKQASRSFGPLPKAIISDKNPITPEKVQLGKILFYETRISADGTVSCARCHPMGLYAADGLKKSVGNNCKVNARNAPTVLNAAGQISAHWIGNRTDVEDQARQSVIGPASFGMPSYEAVEKILKDINGYTPLFKEAFPADKDPVNIGNFAQAIGAFERTLVTPSAFDDFLNGSKDALTEHQKQGLKIFMELGCAGCHSGTFIGGQAYQKFGITEPYWKYTKSEPIDEGRYEVTKEESDKFVFKVPMLRNVEKTSPYFHDGSVVSLEQAEWIMGKIQMGRDLSKGELDDINAFLKSLTGEIPQDALKVPLLPSIE